jgi:hypothetical protein
MDSDMASLSGTTFSEPTITKELSQELWAGPAGIGWIAAFATAVTQTLSPSSIRAFFRGLRAKDKLLFRFGWILLFSVPLFAACGLIRPEAASDISPWFKPIKFAISFATFAWTVGLFLTVLKIATWQRQLARWAITGSVTVEMLCLAAQAWRNTPAGARSFADFLILQGTTAMVSIDTLVTVWLLVVFCGKHERINIADAVQILAIRLSMVIFLLGNAVGGYMLARGSHTVGAADGGPGLPFLGWSTVAGDLRIAHFIAIHAIQIVPLFAWVLWQMAPRPRLKQRRIAAIAMSIVVALVIGGTFLQAMLATPLLALK